MDEINEIIKTALDEDITNFIGKNFKLLPMIFKTLKNYKEIKRIEKKYEMLPFNVKAKLEKIIENAFTNFDNHERDKFIKIAFFSIEKWNVENLNMEEKILYIFSQVKPFNIDFLKYAFNFTNDLGFFYIEDIEKQYPVFKPAFQECINLGIITEIQPKSNLGDIRNSYAISYLGYIIIKLADIDTYNPFFSCKNYHKCGYALKDLNDDSALNIEELFEKIGDLVVDLLQFKDINNDIEPNISKKFKISPNKYIDTFSFCKEAEIYLDKLFDDYLVNEFAVDFLTRFNVGHIGIDKMWRAMKNAYKKIKEINGDITYQKKCLQFPNLFSKIKQDLYSVSIHLNNSLAFRSEKLRLKNRDDYFYYEFK